MDDNKYIVEGEIDLGGYLKVLIKRKALILFLFFIGVTIAICQTFFTPKLYKASVSMMITPSKGQSAFLSPQISSDAANYQSNISIPTHKMLLKEILVLERVIRQLNLTDVSGKNLNTDDLSKKLVIKEVDKTNMLKLEVTDAKPEDAKAIANTWAQEYVEYSQEVIMGEIKGSGKFISDQFEIARKNLIQSEEKVNDFRKKYKLDLMNAELNIKKLNLNAYKQELSNLELLLKNKKNSFSEYKKQIALQDKFVVVSKAITDDALWQLNAKEKNRIETSKNSLKSEIINPIYQDLETRIVNIEIEINTLNPKVEYLNKSIEVVKNESKELENDIIQKEFELSQLNREVDIYKKTYDTFSAKTEEVRIVKAVQLGEIKIISPAILPAYPVEQNKKQVVALMGFVSLVISVFVAFFMEFLERGKKKWNRPNI